MPRRPSRSYSHAPPTGGPPAGSLFAPSPWPLARPLPLLPVAAADIAYTYLYTNNPAHQGKRALPVYLPLLCLARAGVLVLLLAPSRRWRARGGWLLASTGATLIACVWTVCYQTMLRGVPPGGGDGDEGETPAGSIKVHLSFLAAIFYLLLVRLVPARPGFFLRGPPPAATTPTGSSRSPGLAPRSPLSPSDMPAYGHGRRASRGSRRRRAAPLYSTPGGRGGSGSAGGSGKGKGTVRSLAMQDADTITTATMQYGYSLDSYCGSGNIPEEALPPSNASDRGDDAHVQQLELGPSLDPERLSPSMSSYPSLGLGRPQAFAPDDPELGYDDVEGYDEGYDPEDTDADGYDGYYTDDDGDSDDDTSTVSDSSIIDLPRAHLAPLDLELGAGTAGGAALGLAADGAVAVNAGLEGIVAAAGAAGELVRRSASARFLGRSWTSASGDEPAGYGTFRSVRAGSGAESSAGGASAAAAA